jgi:hypothetical protein
MIKLNFLAQILEYFPKEKFQSLVKKYQADKYSKGLDSWSHLVSMVLCQLGKLNSVRDISFGLKSIAGSAVHLGVLRVPSKSSLSYLNKNRSWELFRDYYFSMLDQFTAQHKFRRSGRIKLKRKIFLIDSTTIPLTLKLFNWATFRRKKGAIKIHTVLDYDGCLPVYLNVSDGSTHDISAAREMQFPSGSLIVMDKAYVDFKWLNNLDSTGVKFVTRAKTNLKYFVVEERPVPENQHLIKSDLTLLLIGQGMYKKYPKKIRLIEVYDEEKDLYLQLLCNDFSWTAQTIADAYKARWEIEIFFKQIKSHLKIKSFVGTSHNAVMIQVWTAMITLLTLLLLKAKASFNWNLSNMIALIRLKLFEKTDLHEWLNKPLDKPPEPEISFQGKLF